MEEHAARDAPEHEAREARAPTRTDDDQVGLMVGRRIDDAVGGVAVPQIRDRRDALSGQPRRGFRGDPLVLGTRMIQDLLVDPGVERSFVRTKGVPRGHRRRHADHMRRHGAEERPACDQILGLARAVRSVVCQNDSTKSARPGHQDRARRGIDDFCPDRPQERRREAAVAVTSDDDKVCGHPARSFGDDARGPPNDDVSPHDSSRSRQRGLDRGEVLLDIGAERRTDAAESVTGKIEIGFEELVDIEHVDARLRRPGEARHERVRLRRGRRVVGGEENVHRVHPSCGDPVLTSIASTASPAG